MDKREFEHPEVPDLYLVVEVTDWGCGPSRYHPGDPVEWSVVGWWRVDDATGKLVERKVRRFDLPEGVEAEIHETLETEASEGDI